MLHWNKAHWLAFPIHATTFYQSEYFISPITYATAKFVYDIGSWALDYKFVLPNRIYTVKSL